MPSISYGSVYGSPMISLQKIFQTFEVEVFEVEVFVKEAHSRAHDRGLDFRTEQRRADGAAHLLGMLRQIALALLAGEPLRALQGRLRLARLVVQPQHNAQ